MGKYRRIEVNAYHRRVTVVSGEWRRGEVFDVPAASIDDEVSLNDSELCEPIEPDSREGQQILLEAVRSLERRLLPEALATIRETKGTDTNLEELNPVTEKGPKT